MKRILALFLSCLLLSCAKRGTITGGAKDTLAPVLKASFPKNRSVNFEGKEIKLVFDEYVKLKNISKQLVVSPPMKTAPEIFPQNASKTINIRIKDTLLPNTTYSFNFGQSIEDNNEGNPMSQFKYVFSTGNYIDSLQLRVTVKDALEKKVDNFVTLMLYEMDEDYTDSIVYKKPPRYIANTLDSLKLVTIENIRPGKYKLIALKDNGNNIFNPKSDKIGFHKEPITLPDDDIYEVELFKEVLPFKAVKVFQNAGNKIMVAHEGNAKDCKIDVFNGKESLKTLVTKYQDKDSLQLWFPNVKADSLLVSIEKNKFKKEFWTKVRDMKKDSLVITPEFTGTLPLRERFTLNSKTPIVKINREKINIINKDSTKVAFEPEYDAYMQKLVLNFNVEPQQTYKITTLGGAFEDFYGKSSDSLFFRITTKNTTDYGNLKLQLNNVKRFPIIVELTDYKGNVKYTAFSENQPNIEFLNIEPMKYTIRVIYDDNKNQLWDTGNFIEQRQSEEVIYFPKEIDVRANWDVMETFTLGY